MHFLLFGHLRCAAESYGFIIDQLESVANTVTVFFNSFFVREGNSREIHPIVFEIKVNLLHTI
jgi:hypothetical protein